MSITSETYILCNKDIEVATFRCARDSSGLPNFFGLEATGAPLPFGLNTGKEEGIGDWLRRRRAPGHRAHIKELLRRCGCNDLEGYINFSHCAGLNDTFWVKSKNSVAGWADISLYRNKFDDIVARLAFDGCGLNGGVFSSGSPELSTDGSFAKCWKRRRDEIYLLKRGTGGAANAGLEPYCEVLASQIAQSLCDESVPYRLANHHGAVVSECRLFTSEETGYAPIYHFIKDNALFDDIIKFYDELGCGEQFRQMVVFDALTLNPDRHLGNFGVLFDTDRLLPIKMAPVFDGNLALCPYAPNEELANQEKCVSDRVDYFGRPFNQPAISCMTPGIRQRLVGMRDFSFTDDDCVKIGLERKRLLEKLVNFQIDNILERRVISAAPPMPTQVKLDDLTMVFNPGDFSFDSVETAGFELTTEDGGKLVISMCKCDVNQYDGKKVVDIYQADVLGESSCLRVKEVNDLWLVCRTATSVKKITPASIEVQLGRGGGESEVSSIKPVTAWVGGSLESLKYEISCQEQAALDNIAPVGGPNAGRTGEDAGLIGPAPQKQGKGGGMEI